MRGIGRQQYHVSPTHMARAVAVAVSLLVWGISAVPATPAVAATAVTAHPAAAAGSASFNWPEFHRSTSLRGYSPNSTISKGNAASLGVKWDTSLYGAALDSPVVAWDSTLGKTLVYVGTEQGNVLAINLANGQIIWATRLGAPIRTTPVVRAGSVYVGTFNSARIYKLNASTGAIGCSVAVPQPIEGTPVVATPPGGVSTLYVGTNDSMTADGPEVAIKTSDCKLAWSFTGYGTTSGSWDAVSYGVDAKNRPLILFGTADPDSAVYALNAVTGAKVWRFAVDNPSPGVFDIGAGVTISSPGANGFADGVAYVPSKLGIMYALDLTTGAKIWSFNFNKALGANEGGRSTAALDGTDLVFGYNGGLVDLDAVHGTMRWHYKDPSGTEALSSPAIIGAPGSQVVAVGDLAGGFEVVSLASGTQLYHYQTGNYITASPAVSNGNILITSADGFLYDFAVNGGNDTTLPATAFTSPADFSTIANPNGSLTVKGTVSDASGIARAVVAVQANGPDGPWWDAAARRWVSGPIGNPVTVASPGATSTSWTFSYPVPHAGGAYVVTAYGVSSSGQSDIRGARDHFAVLAASGPHISATPRFVAPAGATTVSGGGFGASETVAISLLGQTLAKTTTTATGNIPATKVTIPAGTVFGQTSLTAKGKTSGKSATAAITVANSWDQVGYGHGHTGFEPNDDTLNELVHAGSGLFLDPAWQYQSGAPINTAPAVADSIAYTANTAGKLTAIDVHNGAPMWTWKDSSGAAINGSPAVDPTRRLVFVGADDGTLDAISASNGKLVWSKAIGGHVHAPVFGGGDVYVTTSTGIVEAVAESSGAKSWSVNTNTAISAAPSLETADKILVVTESNGSVLGLASGSGATHWTFHSGGAVSAPAAVSAGVVYFGSADDSVYALSAKTGTKIWSFKTLGPVADTPALTSVGTPGGVLEVVVGSGDGNVYMLKASSGAKLIKVAFKNPVIGVAALHGVGIIDTSTGVVGAIRTYTNLNLWDFHTGAGIASPPAVVDGTVYVGAGDGRLYAFTSYGQLPDT